MTATPQAATTPRAPVHRPRNWRWLRLAIPFAVVLALLVGTLVVHATQEPDVTDPAYLSPTSPAAIGGKRLADQLQAHGTTVDRVTRTADAIRIAAEYGGAVTIFIPAPSLANPAYLRMLPFLPAGTRVVLVEPSALTLDQGGIRAGTAGTRWATKAVPPGCALPEAQAAGVAALYHVRYGTVGGQSERCYGGALVTIRYAGSEVVLAGANEPFRNDRLDEYGNAALAAGLLSTRPRVVWLDLHRSEPPPGTDASDQPTTAPGTGDPAGRGGGGGGAGGGDTGSDDRGSSDTPPTPYWKLLPPWAWAALGLLLLAAIAYALARARRLGPPVGEPLPVVVRATETVEGRGRLYQRARARDAALQALRDAALVRLRDALDLPPDDAAPVVASAVAVRTGLPMDYVGAVLFGARPDTDQALVRLAAGLDHVLDMTKGIPR